MSHLRLLLTEGHPPLPSRRDAEKLNAVAIGQRAGSPFGAQQRQAIVFDEERVGWKIEDFNQFRKSPNTGNFTQFAVDGEIHEMTQRCL